MMRRKRQSQREPIIAMINIIFLMLIFFMVAGSLSGRPDGSLEFVRTDALDCCVPPDALVVMADGRMSYGGAPVASPAAYLASLPGNAPPARIVPDRNLPANDLLAIIAALREAGAGRIIILTEHTP